MYCFVFVIYCIYENNSYGVVYLCQLGLVVKLRLWAAGEAYDNCFAHLMIERLMAGFSGPVHTICTPFKTGQRVPQLRTACALAVRRIFDTEYMQLDLMKATENHSNCALNVSTYFLKVQIRSAKKRILHFPADSRCKMKFKLQGITLNYVLL